MPGGEQVAAGERRGQHQHVLHPLPRPHRLEHPAGDAHRGARTRSAGRRRRCWSWLPFRRARRRAPSATAATAAPSASRPARRWGSARRAPAATAPSAAPARRPAGGRSSAPNSTAAAVVEVACADGKLSRLGVPTSTRTRGSSGPGTAHHPLHADGGAVGQRHGGGGRDPVAAPRAGRPARRARRWRQPAGGVLAEQRHRRGRRAPPAAAPIAPCTAASTRTSAGAAGTVMGVAAVGRSRSSATGRGLLGRGSGPHAVGGR